MRQLLDENLPKCLKLDFPNHEVFTVTRSYNSCLPTTLMRC
jgi:hypothetical protein